MIGIYLALTFVRGVDATKGERETQDPFGDRPSKFMTVEDNAREGSASSISRCNGGVGFMPQSRVTQKVLVGSDRDTHTSNLFRSGASEKYLLRPYCGASA